MQPKLILALAAVFAVPMTLGLSAHADGNPPPPTIALSGGAITVTAQGATHVNSSFPWSFKDGGGNKVKQLADFSFSGGSATAPTVAAVSGVPTSGTLRGGYCLDTGCYTFTASCAASACAITGN